jgi:hypothetical protein
VIAYLGQRLAWAIALAPLRLARERTRAGFRQHIG